MKTFLLTQNIAFYVRNHDSVSVSFPALKPKIEHKIVMKTWDILKATYLIALTDISNDNTAYLCEISRYIKCIDTRTKHLLCGIRGRGCIWVAIALERGRAHPFLLRLLDSLVIDNILAKFEKNISSGFFQGNDLKETSVVLLELRLIDLLHDPLDLQITRTPSSVEHLWVH